MENIKRACTNYFDLSLLYNFYRDANWHFKMPNKTNVTF